MSAVAEAEGPRGSTCAVSAPPAQSPLRHVRYESLVAGLSGGVVSTLVLHPLDLVKIRFAVSDGLEFRPKYNGILHCLTTVWKHEGLRGLYQGVTPNMWGAGASWGLYFFFYNAIKAYKKEEKLESLSATEHLVSAAEAGVMTLCITNPIWVTKTRLVLQYEAGVDPSKRQYKGMFDALAKIYKKEGIRGLYKGFVPGLFGTSHGALQFMAYEDLKTRYNKYKNRPSDTKLNTAEYITMAALSKIFAVSATYPYQVVRARLQDQHNTYSGVVDVICRTWRKEGVRGFYKGIVPNVIRVTPACCITFAMYEHVSSFLLGLKKENN
ncbi:mitochondrial folate transporter/carrier isoform X1 [Alligator mississippiensis]|uniref:Solute carrier family 25 member 32 n=1 Tax=Alligator mississippiensis TaxID=8496 RepID=A0A151MY54_ALLMI|nr:mitochondrial folate transporter/carrier isoform X1 [Alligator mississippiensis]KYO29349.1 mitochondrial folate transporter/carrier [Alligator mississippiensis]